MSVFVAANAFALCSRLGPFHSTRRAPDMLDSTLHTLPFSAIDPRSRQGLGHRLAQSLSDYLTNSITQPGNEGSRAS